MILDKIKARGDELAMLQGHDRLQYLVDERGIKDEVTFDTLIENGLAKKKDLVKILGGGELKAKLKVSAHKFSASAKEAIEKAGGEAITL